MLWFVHSKSVTYTYDFDDDVSSTRVVEVRPWSVVHNTNL